MLLRQGGAGPAAKPAAGRRALSVCVLPFANMSGDAEQAYFSDGISEDIITDLSKVSALSVVSRNSAFQFKGKHVDVRQVARQLDVSHVLEGSVRKAGNRVRITAQLIDGERRQPRLGRALRPRPDRHLRRAGRDFPGHRRGSEAEAAAGGEERDRPGAARPAPTPTIST